MFNAHFLGLGWSGPTVESIAVSAVDGGRPRARKLDSTGPSDWLLTGLPTRGAGFAPVLEVRDSLNAYASTPV